MTTRTPHRNDAARLTDDEARELRRRVARDGAYRTARELGTSTTMLDKLLGGAYSAVNGWATQYRCARRTRVADDLAPASQSPAV